VETQKLLAEFCHVNLNASSGVYQKVRSENSSSQAISKLARSRQRRSRARIDRKAKHISSEFWNSTKNG
jgi:hypothetical protein